MVSVFCTKGGTGKSVVAINLAVALAKRTIQPVVLVDADLQFGDVALMLQLQPTHTIAEAVQAGDRLDGTMLENLLLRHPPSGLLVLAAPTEPSSADQIGRADLARILNILRERCAYVVVDTSANFAEVTLAALESSDDILVMAGLDVMSLKSAADRAPDHAGPRHPLLAGQVRAQPGQHPGRADRGRRRAGPAAEGRRGAAERHLGGGVGQPGRPRGDQRAPFEVRQEHRRPGGHAHDTLRRPRRSPDKPCEGNAMTLSDHLRQAGGFLTSEEARARPLEEVHLRVHQRLIEELGPELSQGRLTAKDLRPRVNAQLQAALADETTPLSLADKARLGEDIANDILGYGPIQGYLEDPEVSEVMVNGPDKVYVERDGKIERTPDELHRRDPPAPRHRQDRR